MGFNSGFKGLIFIPIWLYTRKAELADPVWTSLRFTASAFSPQKFMLRSGLSVVFVRTANNCQVFGIPKQTKLHPEAPCDHMVITTCWSSHVFASDHVSLLAYRVVNLPSQWSNLEFVCFDDAFFSAKEEGSVSWTNHCSVIYLRLFYIR